MRDLHTLLLETEVREGNMVCGNCGHEYKIKEGIANFLLPSHLGELLLFCFSFLSCRRLGLSYNSLKYGGVCFVDACYGWIMVLVG
jgi:hypothetical protein